VSAFKNTQSVSDDTYKKAFVQLQDTKAELAKTQAELSKTSADLDRKEERFKNYIAKTGQTVRTSSEEIKKYSDIVNSYKSKIGDIDKELNKMQSEKDIIYDLRASIMQDAEDIGKMKNDVSKKLDFINKHIQKITNTDSSPKDVADVPWLMGGARKTQNTQQTQNMPTNVQESIIYTEGYTPAPSRQYRNAKYNEWITKHFLGLFNLFKGRYAKDLEEKVYSDKQVADTLEEYIPLLYNLGNDKTPLTPTEVIPWAENVKDKLWELPAQYELFNESLDKTYARMLDNIIGLDYIKKG
jgi:myosin heavy subunit